MKDLYSFVNQAEQLEVRKCKNAYINIFNRLGIGDKTYVTLHPVECSQNIHMNSKH